VITRLVLSLSWQCVIFHLYLWCSWIFLYFCGRFIACWTLRHLGIPNAGSISRRGRTKPTEEIIQNPQICCGPIASELDIDIYVHIDTVHIYIYMCVCVNACACWLLFFCSTAYIRKYYKPEKQKHCIAKRIGRCMHVIPIILRFLLYPRPKIDLMSGRCTFSRQSWFGFPGDLNNNVCSSAFQTSRGH